MHYINLHFPYLLTDTSHDNTSSNNWRTAGQIVDNNDLGVSMTVFKVFDFGRGPLLCPGPRGELIALPRPQSHSWIYEGAILLIE